jgi:phosphate:Na+ symporter
MTMTPVSVAMLNTGFRLATMIVLLPFMKLIEKLVFWLIKDSEDDAENQADFSLLEERFLNYPVLAITQTQTVMNDVAKRSRKAVYRALGLLTKWDSVIFNKVKVTEALVDKYEDKLGTYLMKLTVRKLTPAEKQKVSKLLYTISDFESLSDYAVNIGFIADDLNETKTTFSEQAQQELSVLEDATKEIVDLVVDGFIEDDLEKIKKVGPLRVILDKLCDDLKENHIARLREGKCALSDGHAFNDILSYVERLGAHCSNIAVAMNKLETQAFGSTDYVRGIRAARNDEYLETIKAYEDKYSIHRQEELLIK